MFFKIYLQSDAPEGGGCLSKRMMNKFVAGAGKIYF
jgi:hypothetical protein